MAIARIDADVVGILTQGQGNNGVEGTVTVIDSKTDTITKTIQTPGKGAGRMAVSPNGKWAASTHGDTKDVAIIDAEKKEVVASVELLLVDVHGERQLPAADKLTLARALVAEIAERTKTR